MDANIYVGDFPFSLRDITSKITQASMSWSLDGASQLSFSVWDRDYAFLENNYFQVRRAVVYGNSAFTIASTRISQANGQGALVECEARDVYVQAMKLNKDPAAIAAGSATEYAQIAAYVFGLGFQAEFTPVVPNITRAEGTNSDESVWSVLQSLASEARFLCFVIDGVLYFGSERWLLRRYGAPMLIGNGVLFWWPYPPAGWDDAYRLIQSPTCYTSDDDPYAAEFTAQVNRANGTQLRPGVTAYLGGAGVPGFRGAYLITGVDYQWRTPDPVSVTCRTPERPTDKDNKKIPEFRDALG